MGVEEDIIPTMALGSGSKKQGKKTNKKFIHLKFIGMPNEVSLTYTKIYISLRITVFSASTKDYNSWVAVQWKWSFKRILFGLSNWKEMTCIFMVRH